MIFRVPLDRIHHNPYQYRLDKVPGGIEALARSIGQHGLQQPPKGRLLAHPNDIPSAITNPVVAPELLVSAAGGLGQYLARHPYDFVQLNFGHRRLAAYGWLLDHPEEFPGDWSAMPIEVVELTNEQMYVGSFIENDHRVDPTPIERAMAVDTGMRDFGWSIEQVAARLGLSRSVASNALRLLKLPKELRDDLHAGGLSERQGIALLPLFDVDPAQARAHHFEVSIQAILGEARKGVSSDTLRERVADAVRWLSHQVQPTLVTAPGPAIANSELPRVDDNDDDDDDTAGEAPRQMEKQDRFNRPQQPQPANDEQSTPMSAFQSVSPVATPSLAGAPSLAPKPTQDEAPDGKSSASTAAPLTWEQSTIMLTVTLMPQDSYGPNLRPTMIGLRANGAAPKVCLTRLPDNLANIALSTIVISLVQEMQTSLTPSTQEA